MSAPVPLCFRPSNVEGLADVTEVTLWPDRLELIAGGERVVHKFVAIARWPRPAWLWCALFWLGYRRSWPTVADRDWFAAPSARFFEFYTQPPLKISMPADETPEGETFIAIKLLLGTNGFSTSDLG